MYVNWCLCAQVFPDKRSLKLLKSQSINVNWYQYCPETAVILLSTTVQGNILQPFAFRVRRAASQSDYSLFLGPKACPSEYLSLLTDTHYEC